MDFNIVYMGTPEFSVKPLEELSKNYNIVGVVTQPDKEVGRKKEIKQSPVKKFAIKHDIKVLQPVKIKEEYQDILDLKPDLIITCAYGQILPSELLNYPKFKCINIHASLLPKLRGGAPIHHAIIEGFLETGVTIMYMSKKMDQGDILYQEKIKIEENDNVETLHDKLSNLGSEMIVKFLPDFFNNNFIIIKQEEKNATYGYNITREDEKISFNEKTRNIYNKIRGLSPWPASYCFFQNKILKLYSARIGNSNKKGEIGEVISIYEDGIGVKTLDGEIVITEFQIEGKRRCLVKEYLNGIRNKEDLLKEVLS